MIIHRYGARRFHSKKLVLDETLTDSNTKISDGGVLVEIKGQRDGGSTYNHEIMLSLDDIRTVVITALQKRET